MKVINNLFENEKNLTVEIVRKELNGMKNSQPPKSPTFIINQQNVKDRITQKLSDCDKGWDFAHVVLTGRVGGGKTHFLNWIESRLKDQGDYYIVKFQVQETNIVKYSFVRMIASKLFQLYFSDFSLAFNRLIADANIKTDLDKDTIISKICEKFEIGSSLATVLYTIYKGGDKSSAAIRILGASHGRTEITKVGIKELNNSDYINIIQFFIKYKPKEGFLLILLDEFEHAFSALTTAARRNFFISYKEFIDKVISFEPPAVALITSVTEQYEGNLKEEVSKREYAIWTRLEHHVLELSEFKPSNVNDFEELFLELAVRYKKGYEYDIGIDYPKEMKKQFLDYLGGNTTHAISYRDAISNMLKIMDDLRLKDKTLADYQKNRIDSDIPIDDFVNIESLPIVKTDEERILEEVNAQWQKAHHNQRPGLIKSSLEKLFSDSQYEIVRFKEEFGIEELASILYVRKSGSKKLIYIATASNPKSLGNKFQKCLEFKDELSNINDDEFKTVFIYQKEAETETIIKYQNNHPDIISLSLEHSELLNLLAYNKANTEALKNRLFNKMEIFTNNLFY